MSNAETIAGRTLDEWQEFARRDDCLERMVPSDLRQLIGCLSRAIDATRADEHVLADLVAKYYRREIGVLMQQAEHWASENYPLAVHHRVLKADAYYQIVSLCERFPAFNENPFDKMREELARPPVYPPGTYPPTAEIHAYRYPAHVVEKLKTASRAAGGPGAETSTEGASHDQRHPPVRS